MLDLAAIFVDMLLVLLVNAGAAALWLYWLRDKETSFPRFRSSRWFYPYLALGAVAGLVSGFAESAFDEFLEPSSFGFAGAFMAWFPHAAIEELAKFGALLVIAARLSPPREPFDMVAEAASVGLGFASMENVVYGLSFGGFELSLFRSFLTIQGHMLYAAIPALCYGLARLDWRLRKERLKIGLPFFGLFAASVLHASYNLAIDGIDLRGFAQLLCAVELLAFARVVSRAAGESPYKSYPFDKWKAAVAAIDKGLDADPGNPNLFFRQGLYYLAGGRWADACVAFDGAAEHGKRVALARSFYAAALYADGETEEAKELFGDYWPSVSARERRLFHRSLERAMPSRRILRERLRMLTELASWTPAAATASLGKESAREKPSAKVALSL